MNHGLSTLGIKLKKCVTTRKKPDITINKFIFQSRTKLTDRLKAERCENCDRTNQL
ncbi:hypothetical protein OC683_01425 ['Crotalaria aegyptiaca' phytoplasma]|uniref:Uncharacterized protein n=1 Tax=Candidatus Phytoplasma crotalariae TaxID=2982627 RepID=A0ABT9D2N1_9MOLU|nr:hypothetical protein ['Crotalaria aegyptiaca' phytoplasma]MDO8059271.1 hypothetical protein ['Crotalaria aegyptiaca' phytoplasma]